MNILIACEESQVVCKAFRDKGHNAFSCDLKLCSGSHPEWHILGDCTFLLDGYCSFYTMDGSFHSINDTWDLVIAHPPCTYLSKAGARWLYPKAGCLSTTRLFKGNKAKSFFLLCLNANAKRICVENPTPLKVFDLPKPSQIIQPYYFGHPYSKRTLLWLKNLPLLQSTNILEEYEPFCPSNTSAFSRGCGGSRGIAHTAEDMSKTFTGVAIAMSEQWNFKE